MSADPDHMITWASAELRRHYAPEIAALKQRAARNRLRRRVLAGALAAVMLAMGTILSMGWRTVAAPATAPLTLTLADDIRLDLDAGASVKLPLLPWRHRARVVDGEVVFDIRHDDNRPFEVVVGDTRLTDLGTRFLVSRTGDTLSLAVYDGKVMVNTAQGLAAVVTPGHAVNVNRDAITPHPLTDEALAIGWRDGLLIFRDTPLSDVVARLSRYRAQPVQVGDPVLNRLKVNGVFHIADADGALAILQQALPVRVQPESDRTLLLFPATGRTTPPSRR